MKLISGLLTVTMLITAVAFCQDLPKLSKTASKTEPDKSQKLPALPKAIKFGDVHEVVLSEDNPELGGFMLIDFDSNKLFDHTSIKVDAPHSTRFTEIRAKANEIGIDAYCEVNQSFAGLVGMHVVGIPVREGDWEPSYRTMEQLKQSTIGFPCPMSVSRRLPATWIFRTRENYGVLQFLEVTNDPKNPKQDGSGIKFRYKLVESAKE